MSDHPRPTRLSRLLARCYPRELREQYADDIARFIDDARRDSQARFRLLGGAEVTLRLTKDALLSMAASLRHRARHPERRALPPPTPTRRGFSMDTLWQDIRYSLRGFLRRPGFTAVALITLALGIGGTSAVFTLVNSALLRSLPYPDPHQLVNIWGTDDTGRQLLLSIPDLEDMRARNRTFTDIGITRTQSVNLTGSDRPDRVVGAFITANSLKLLGATTAMGRLFSSEETRVGAGEQVVVINHDTWQTRFGARKDMIGQTLVLNGRPHVVIGVTSAGFKDPMQCDLWLPITSAPSRGWFDRANPSVWALGRLKPGISAGEGQRDLQAIAAAIAAERSAAGTRNSVTVIDLQENLVGNSRFMLMVLFGAVATVLLIVCVNIANLQLVRASTRLREMSLRAALGANRGRLVSQVMTESVLLAFAGGALGIGLGQAAVKALVQLSPATFPTVAPLEPDARVLAFSIGTALLTGLLFGAPAALSGTRANLQGALRARNEGVSARRFNTRNVLVVSELALCIVLLAVAGFFTRSLQSLRRIDAGFNGGSVLTAEFRLPSVKYDDGEKVRSFMTAVLRELRAAPGALQVALVDAVPLSGNFGAVSYVPQGQPEPAPGAAPSVQYTAVSDNYFRTVQIPQMAGRDFTERDNAGAEPVVIVNQLFAEQTWPGESAIGKTVRLQFDSTETFRIVGVVGNAKQFTMSEPLKPQVYLAKSQAGGIFTSVVMRTATDADAMGNTLRKAIWAVDRDQPVWKVRTLQSLVDRDLAPAKFSVGLISGFALLALLLGTIGVYGVMSFSVQQRSREMGIRLALGARGGQVLQLVMRSGMEVVAVAVVIGLVGALVAGRVLQSRLYNVGAADPLTLAAVPLLLGAVAMVACWLPARKAARLDPVTTLRAD